VALIAYYILSTIVVIGSHGLLASMVNPTDEGAVALRRKSLARWLTLIAISSILVIGVISTGGSAEDLFGPGVSLPQLMSLTVIAVLFAIVATIVVKRRGEPHATA
jgi:cytochrome bd-type quinol oxidase subunit 2